MDLLKEAKEILGCLTADRRAIHRKPELGMDLPHTRAYVKKRLTEMGYEPQDCGKAGITVTVGKPGKCILLRADMDALPMKEETGLPFATTTNAAHTCGHDSHTAMLLGAAQLLKNHEAELNGTVKLMFQPAEELLQGAKDMIENGILENPHVDASFGLHIDPLTPAGCLSWSRRYVCASADVFSINIKGHGGHGAMPQNAIDPIVVAAYIIIALQEIQTREISGQDMIVMTYGVIQSGSKENIIPDSALIRGTLRALDGKVLANVKRRMEEICKGIGAVYRCDVDFTWDFGCGPNSNNEELALELYKYQSEIIGEENMIEAAPAMGSEDFSYVSEAVPSVFCWMGVKPEGLENPAPLHSPKMLLDEAAMPYGAALHANCAIKWLKNNG